MQHKISAPPNWAITGASSGIGLAIALALAERGVRVLMVCRPSQRADAAFAQVKQVAAVPPTLIHADLSRIQEATLAAQSLAQCCSQLHVMIHNAGVWPMHRQLTPEGFETSFAVNHLAPFVMNRGLLPLLRATPAARIVQITAGLYGKGRIDLHRTPIGDDFHRLTTYANTKLWNLLATLRLSQELKTSSVTVNAIHPGVVRTRLGASASFIGAVLWLVKRFWITPELAARGPLRLALDPTLATTTGQLYNQLQPMAPLPIALNQTLRDEVVARTEALLQEAAPGVAASPLTSHR